MVMDCHSVDLHTQDRQAGSYSEFSEQRNTDETQATPLRHRSNRQIVFRLLFVRYPIKLRE